MSENEQFVDEIISKKREIARAIALGFADGDEEKAKAYFPSFYKKIMDSKMFILEGEQVTNKYEKNIEDLLRKISGYIGYSVNETFYRKESVAYLFDPLKARNVADIPKEVEEQLHKAYLSASKTFLRLDVTYGDFINVFRREGFEHSIRLAKEVKNLQKKTKMSELKTTFSTFFGVVRFDRTLSAFGNMTKEYNITSIDDLMKFHTEISSFFVDTSTLTEEEKKIIEENKKDFINRVNDKSIANNLGKLDRIRRDCEKIFNDKFTKNLFFDTNLKDFFDRYSISLSEENLRVIARVCLGTMIVDGTRSFVKLDGKYESIVFIRDEVYKSDSSRQDNVTIHEHIHCLENMDTSIKARNFNVLCRALNEAMTEYLSNEALKYLSGNILENNVVIEKGTSYESVYDCMLPLLEILRCSELWDDLLYCKINNDFSFLENKIGGDANRIAKIFNDTFVSRQKGESNIGEKIEELEKIVKKIESKNERYHKKTAI